MYIPEYFRSELRQFMSETRSAVGLSQKKYRAGVRNM